jgi:peptidoglycan hydrolase-like protein with peptidoglycan-binding domain
MAKLNVNAGHRPGEPGACYSGRQEYAIARQVRDEFMRQGAALGLEMTDSTEDVSDSVNQQIRKANASGAELAISNHVNAGGGTGFEVFYDDQASAATAALAAKVSAALAAHYGLRDRGAKKDTQSAVKSLGWTSYTRMPALLIEWGFIDNDGDMSRILGDIPGGVKAVYDAVYGTAAGTPVSPVQPSGNEPPPTPAILRRGSTGEAVKVVQCAVGAAADGQFGPETEAKVKDYQAAYGLTVDGLVGAQTMAAINAGKTLTATPAKASMPIIRRGSIGDAVRIWQGIAAAAQDGLFGPETERLTKAWQSAHGLVADGIVGPATWGAAGYTVAA